TVRWPTVKSELNRLRLRRQRWQRHRRTRQHAPHTPRRRGRWRRLTSSVDITHEQDKANDDHEDNDGACERTVLSWHKFRLSRCYSSTDQSVYLCGKPFSFCPLCATHLRC